MFWICAVVLIFLLIAVCMPNKNSMLKDEQGPKLEPTDVKESDFLSASSDKLKSAGVTSSKTLNAKEMSFVTGGVYLDEPDHLFIIVNNPLKISMGKERKPCKILHDLTFIYLNNIIGYDVIEDNKTTMHGDTISSSVSNTSIGSPLPRPTWGGDLIFNEPTWNTTTTASTNVSVNQTCRELKMVIYVDDIDWPQVTLNFLPCAVRRDSEAYKIIKGQLQEFVAVMKYLEHHIRLGDYGTDKRKTRIMSVKFRGNKMLWIDSANNDPNFKEKLESYRASDKINI
ncbi:MAG: hypothetical protein Q4F74_05420 [Synergistaceae bacterium]|nr:hypothetical protein [Synergistaceae bacterium]